MQAPIGYIEYVNYLQLVLLFTLSPRSSSVLSSTEPEMMPHLQSVFKRYPFVAGVAADNASYG